MKILFLDIDGVLNNTPSTLVKVGRELQTGAQKLAVQSLALEFAEGGELQYGQKFTIETIDPVCVALVNRMLAADQNLRIVLSSSHRSMFCGSNYGLKFQFGSEKHLEVLRVYMRALGLVGTPNQLIHDVTERLYGPRGEEVKLWLENHGDEVTHHCAVDDGGDFKSSDCNFVQTNASLGLRSDEYFKIVKHLVIHESAIIF